MRGLIITGIILAVGACDYRAPLDPPVTARLDSSFTLRVGQEAIVEGTSIRLRFDRVAADSRCPIDVLCVWSGDATVRLVLAGEGAPADAVDLRTDLEPRSVDARGHRITLERLLPARSSDDGIATSEYTAEIRVIPLP